jgi:HEPN domain-containing protein
VTNRERADLLFAEAPGIAEEMRRSLDRQRWNLAARRAQEVIELVVKGLLTEMGVEYPRTHDAAPVLIEAIQRRHIDTDAEFLEWLSGHSGRLAGIRGPAFYHEIQVGENEAREAVQAADRVLAFGQDFLAQLRAKARAPEGEPPG